MPPQIPVCLHDYIKACIHNTRFLCIKKDIASLDGKPCLLWSNGAKKIFVNGE